ncbi:MAG TPA: ferritin-like domain-containing protein [Gemmatimonadaceae bacterium]|nr:ferritin-like domain-containing protein [Gemmatimonadaceae bacterium]
MTTPTSTDPQLLAQLNDLLQLDHDAVGAYTVAIDALENPRYRVALERFRGDHERHIVELTQLILERGGTPIEMPHVPTGVFKLAMQQAGTLAGGDKGVLLAFKANERQVRDKYRRLAEASEDLVVADVLSRGADDESKHYGWVVTVLEELGVPSDSPLGRAEEVFERANARVVDATERLERGTMAMAESVKRIAKRPDAGVIAAVAAVGLGFLASRMMRDR